ncbi:Alpha/beta hydrolase fold-3 domain protein [Hoyosella subflava DQS3-9A1]|uniref:Alpha/beta hydrolase fold-3 domain protein n=1 Tax=Hoyosella subflava (strain DSM 45089 / JCM 17490 / NBRC 109087 / DQS3-9A1) TaxID=443218 RepID=F6EER4_HOYSD|nr:Alpha/beta hydrolase fold-3 domain protein [Hoyosella subflava DQS3-9A1]
MLRNLTNVVPLNNPGVWFARQLVSVSMGVLGPPLRGTRVEQVRSGAVRGEWVRGPGVTQSDRAIFYIHGSGYVVCSARTHRGIASRLSQASGAPVFTVDYRLAPEHPFPAAAQDIETAYRWLLGQGYVSDQIVVAGDSAGGHLAVDLFIENARTQTPQPSAAVLFSPLMDLSLSLAEAKERTRRDPMISAENARKLVSLYTGRHPADHPRLKLGLAAGTALPPLLVQAGGEEMLSADAEYLRALVTQAGGSCELEIWPGQMHVFQALPRLVPEARPALRRAGQFITRAWSSRDLSLTEQAG